MQPRLKPVEKKYADMTKKWNEVGLKAVKEMSKQHYSFQDVLRDSRRVKAERNKNKQ